jgi:hypothetical protein
MGFWSWLFGKNDDETATKKEGRQPGAPYGSRPKKPTDEIEPEFRVGDRDFARLTARSVLVRPLSLQEVSKQGNLGFGTYVPCGEWEEYRTNKYGISWYRKDGKKLEWKFTRELMNRLNARELF